MTSNPISDNCHKYLLKDPNQPKNITKVQNDSNTQETKNDCEEEEEDIIDNIYIDTQSDQFKHDLQENIKDEMILFERGHTGNRYSIETKKFALLLYYSSRYSFHLIRQLFCLPCERTIDKFIAPYLQDINESLFDFKCFLLFYYL